jgi:glycine dehydrogenase subunit 1
MDYIPHTPEQTGRMLAALGKKSLNDLFKDIPGPARLKSPLKIPAGVSELETRRVFEKELSANTVDGKNAVYFMGAGAYDHFIPSVIDALVSRGEFLTAYTPYQAELSQGLLQSIWEFQKMSAILTGMEVSNASLYDGAHALVEAVTMAVRITGRKKIIVPDTLNPQHIEVLKTYNISGRFELESLSCPEGIMARSELEKMVDDKTAAVIVPFPNYFGLLEEIKPLADIAHKHGALLITSFYPIAAGLYRTPGELGADIVTAEGQPLGLHLSFGGPWLGMLATKKKFIHSMPGRIVGRTVDTEGKEAFVLTLQAREQHIKREKASSNICSNQALAALRAAIYLSLMGAEGLKKTALACHANAHKLKEKLLSEAGLKMLFDKPFFNEFTVRFNNSVSLDRFIKACEKKNIFPGVRIPAKPDCLVMCATEMNTPEQIDEITGIAEITNG